jgi:hypothetical protein
VTPLQGMALGYALGLASVVVLALIRAVVRSRDGEAVDGWGSRERRQMLAARESRTGMWQ